MTNNQSAQLRFLIVAMGPGETSQAISLAYYIFKTGGKIYFALRQPINLPFLETHQRYFSIIITETPEKLKTCVAKINPDIILFFNSKMWGGFKNYPEFYSKPFSSRTIFICVDSNWLFNNVKYPYYQCIPWADKYLINIHPKIFALGLKKNGGNFVLDRDIENKIEPVGFIPSYKPLARQKRLAIRKKYKINKDQKFIFSYFSGFGATHRVWAFHNLIRAVDVLVTAGIKTKVICITKKENLPQNCLQRDWLILKEYLAFDEYYQMLASSDLVFQHQGLATLTQAICARVPVIVNVSFFPQESIPKIHFWEVAPFAKAGVCLLFSKTTSKIELAANIKKLLFNKRIINKMKQNQAKFYSAGEPKAYQIIQTLLKSKLS